jgi:hypothetical protein
MTAFSMVLVEEGIEADLPINLSNMLGLLDQVVPNIEHNNFGYQLASVSRASLRSRWELNVKLVDLRNNKVYEEPVGCLEVQKTSNDTVNFRIPPRAEQDYPGMARLDYDGVYYGSFCCQMINFLYDRGLMQLPGRLPTF